MSSTGLPPSAIDSVGFSPEKTHSAPLIDAPAPWEAAEDCGVRFNLAPPATTLLVSFGGIWDTGARPGFEFVSTATHLPGSVLFLTDIDQVWYQNGVLGVGSSILDVVSFLQEVINEHRFERVVMIGNSAGGYAALLFGGLVGADVVHAFSPQTELINPHQGYFLDKLANARRATTDGALLDLRRALTERVPDTRRTTPALYLHYSRYCRKDRHHAHRMQDIPGIRLISYPSPIHGLAGLLRDADLLLPLLQHALNGSSYDAEQAARSAKGLFWRAVSKALLPKIRSLLPRR